MSFRELIPVFSAPLFNGFARLDEPMKNHTTIRIGGEAPIFLEPTDENSLVFAIKTCIDKGVKFFVIGGGSNIVVDEKLDFAIISTKQFNKVYLSKTPGKAKGLFELASKAFDESKMEDDDGKRFMNCDAGATWGNVCNVCAKNGITGFAEFSGMPGTIGGATYINATCFGLSVSDKIHSVRYLDLEDLQIKEYKNDTNDWGYKVSPFQTSKRVILTVEFEVEKNHLIPEEKIRKEYYEYLKQRALKKHFENPSAGSVFRNIPDKGIIAGKIIDECGLKGLTVGGAKVADYHGNFIINVHNATSLDVRTLVKMIQEKVKEEKNVDLKCEIIFVPENVDICR
ncbi:MAG: UDP-N-acetylmuramate dehydrogenase [Treponema sp.]|nr:UDP-N-acetylmuramate dehydrogenase [Treponema sp.]